MAFLWRYFFGTKEEEKEKLNFEFSHYWQHMVCVAWKTTRVDVSNLQLCVKLRNEMPCDFEFQAVDLRQGAKNFEELRGEKYTVFFKYNALEETIHGRKDFKMIYDLPELIQLQLKAKNYNFGQLKSIRYLYRNKPVDYYSAVRSTNHQVESAYLKDHNGDLFSPINGRLKGLFFNGVIVGGVEDLEEGSPFGPVRLKIEASLLFNECSRLFFADFYCNTRQHYVTLVVTKLGSEAWYFCSSHLLPLNSFNNPWLCHDRRGNVSLNHNLFLRVEIFYAHDVDTKIGSFVENVSTRGIGRSTATGFPKNRNCHICNL